MSSHLPHNSYFHLLHELWTHVSGLRRLQFICVLMLTVLSSVSEMLTIGAVFPFIMVLTSPEKVLQFSLVKPFLAILNIQNNADLTLLLTAGFCFLAVMSGILRVVLLWSSNQLSCRTGSDISIDIYRRTLYQPYAVHISRNSSTLISGLTVKSNAVVSGVINPVLMLISSLMMLLAILTSLIFIDYKVALFTLGIFSIIYTVIIRFTRKRLKQNSAAVTSELTYAVKALQEGLGGIRDVLIDGAQSAYCKTYESADYKMRRAQANTLFIGQSPRYLIEALGTTLIALIAYRLILGENGIEGALPVLGALALGAQRMLPIVQQAYASWTSILGNYGNLKDVLELLKQPLPDDYNQQIIEPLVFRQAIRLSQLDFKYNEGGPSVLNAVNLKVPKGAKYGFMGETGSGKSTLIDIIMGLLRPSSGAIHIDDVALTAQNQRAWQRLIAHVPQSIFLTDASVAENIAFGIPEDQIDLVRVAEAARMAQIADLVENWPHGYQTVVGERGVKLSGGQRQRIGIARALYKKSEVIVLDEATSALDANTESAVMQSIAQLGDNVTVLIIAHRLSTLRMCDQIVELKNGSVYRQGNYQEIIGNIP